MVFRYKGCEIKYKLVTPIYKRCLSCGPFAPKNQTSGGDFSQRLIPVTNSLCPMNHSNGDMDMNQTILNWSSLSPIFVPDKF